MSSNTRIGITPALGRLSLVDGQDFYHEFGAAPAGSTVWLEFMSGDRETTFASFPVEATTGICRVDAEDLTVVLAGAWFRLWVNYPDDGGTICWIAGPVERNFR